jgi:Na+-translocating ferredoxin:NAD+ oxidoreductase RNF subunit RnfB
MLINILTALAVVVSVGLFFGVLLALFINLFGVEEDKKVKEIRAALPGINCGACGFTGCNDYAEALSKGKAKPSLCIPGATSTAQELSEILGIEVEKPKDVVAFVHCNGTCDAASEKAIYDGIVSCKAYTMIYGGPKACSYGCLGCGDCANVCVSHAINIVNRIAKVDTSRCIGCGMCAKECSRKIISMIPQEVVTVVYCASKDKGADDSYWRQSSPLR